MYDKETRSKPLTSEEEKDRLKVAEQIEKAAIENNSDTVSRLRRQLTDAAKQGIISRETVVDTALPPAVPPKNPPSSDSRSSRE